MLLANGGVEPHRYGYFGVEHIDTGKRRCCKAEEPEKWGMISKR